MTPDSVCLLCAATVLDTREFHDACWPEAKRHLDAVLEMARRKYGSGFAIQINDVPGQYPEVFSVPVGPIIGGVVLEGPPAEVEKKTVEELESSVTGVIREEFLQSPCLCEKDADNRCPKCIETICGFVKKLVELQAEFLERQSAIKQVEEVCDVCSNEYADYSMARIVREVFAPGLKNAGPAFEPTMRELITAMKARFERDGVRAWPLLERALEDLFRRPPWEA